MDKCITIKICTIGDIHDLISKDLGKSLAEGFPDKIETINVAIWNFLHPHLYKKAENQTETLSKQEAENQLKDTFKTQLNLTADAKLLEDIQATEKSFVTKLQTQQPDNKQNCIIV